MVARAEGEVGLAVVQGVVHPAHVPLVVEAQATVLGRIGDQRPRGGLLGDHHDVGVVLAHGVIELLHEGDGLEVFLGALLVELLLARVVDAKVEVQHAGDAVHADAVCMVLVDPVEQVGDQERLDLLAAQVELAGAPVGMDGVLIEHLAVELGQAMRILAEAAGHPVQNDADACTMAHVDKALELLGVAKTAGRSVVAGYLVAPAAVEGVLHDGQHLDVAVAHLLDVVHELDRERTVFGGLAVLDAELVGDGGRDELRPVDVAGRPLAEHDQVLADRL